MDGAHSSLLSDWLFFPQPCPSGLSSIAILLPFLINLLFTTSTTFPVCPGTEEPAVCSFLALPPPPYTSLIQYSHSCLTMLPRGVKVGKWLLPSESHSSNMMSVHGNTTVLIIHSPEMLGSFCLYPSPGESVISQGLEPHRATLTNRIPRKVC